MAPGVPPMSLPDEQSLREVLYCTEALAKSDHVECMWKWGCRFGAISSHPVSGWYLLFPPSYFQKRNTSRFSPNIMRVRALSSKAVEYFKEHYGSYVVLAQPGERKGNEFALVPEAVYHNAPFTPNQ